MKKDLTAAALAHQFVTRFTSMVVVEDSGARSHGARTRVKHTKEFKDELEDLFANKAVREMVEKEQERLAAYEESSRVRRSPEATQRAAVFHPLRWILPAAALVAVLRLKRWFTRF